MQKLFRQIDNAPLILFRIFFGFLFACETFGAILTGWVRNNFIIPRYTFSHIGMDWLQPLPGYGMYVYFGVMGCLSLMVMVGYRYRYSMSLLALLWAGVYFMQKTSYNNHYYLLMLIAFIMIFLPANRYASLDAKRNPAIKRLTMPYWCSFVMILQVTIVYFYATIAKFYPDWMDGTFTKNLLSSIDAGAAINAVFAQKWFYLFIAYAGIAFDGLIIPLLLWKRSRTIAVLASLAFHLFNSIFLKIGIFPYFALSFAVFFYAPETIRAIFFRQKPTAETDNSSSLDGKVLFYSLFIPYFIVQVLLPIRHHFIKGDVLWTEEGHRLSWRMMLRDRSGYVNFNVVDKKTGKATGYMLNSLLTEKQINGMATKPDMIWQTAQKIKEEQLQKGREVSIYVTSMASINRKPLRQLVNPNVDLAAVEWNYLGHNEWVLLYE